jgi:dolichol-phosphate mannosyltransferase
MPVPFEPRRPDSAELIREENGGSAAGMHCSVVVPVFNEAAVIAPVLAELKQVLSDCHLQAEVLVVDDGSSDGTDRIVTQMLTGWSGARLFRLTRNGGQAGALYYGIQHAQGRVIVLMDGDGQNDPADIPKLLDLLSRADMAVGIRVHRQDSLTRRMMSRLANWVRRRILKDGVSDTGCGLKAFHDRVKDAFIPFRTLYSFMPALAVAAGFSVVEAPVSHRPRQGGQSNYGVRQFLWRPLLDLFGVWWFSQRRCSLPQDQGSPSASSAAETTGLPTPAVKTATGESGGVHGKANRQTLHPPERGSDLIASESSRLTTGL